ncbi:hypothetical protein E2X15_16625 [Salmonella enterica]|nr:hypothetical protein [Salmonella enterica]EAT5310262.1 hypothetical protein [Salmonella enterica subsp. arizonae serovar 13,23:gz51:-]EAV3776090.1 hypothetical protein [Salmonella enterica]EAV5295966.1 hypothetical protein [Salmonella enterica subsp. arizonae serovar 13,23:gz51:-]EAW2114775.1 hypothetical protein [Salmonella enterica subsp. enterica]
MKYNYKETLILTVLMVFFLLYFANINLIYFILIFEHCPNFKLKRVAYVVAIHIAYYGCN